MRFLPATDRAHPVVNRRTSARRLSARLCAIVAVAAIVVPAVASAASVPASGTLYFARPTAKLVGETILVPVQCVGAKGSTCSGVLSVQAGEATSEAPFSVTVGGGRIVSIPVTGAVSGASVVASARSAQADGGYVTATEVLRLR